MYYQVIIVPPPSMPATAGSHCMLQQSCFCFFLAVSCLGLMRLMAWMQRMSCSAATIVELSKMAAPQKNHFCVQWGARLQHVAVELAIEVVCGIEVVSGGKNDSGSLRLKEKQQYFPAYFTVTPSSLFNTIFTIVTVQDYKNIEAGLYKLPWDMTTLRNRQYDPRHVLSTAATFATEASNTLRRRFGGAPEKVWLQSSMYPDYYLNTFHYQVRLPLLSDFCCCVCLLLQLLQ